MVRTFRYGLLSLLLFCHASFALKVIEPNTIISSNILYRADTLDMNHGSFIIRNGATLIIDKCTINGTISPGNPFLFNLQGGNLVLKKNKIQILSSSIVAEPTKTALFHVIYVNQGSLKMRENNASVNTSYTVGLLLTNEAFTTTGFDIEHNIITNFHGALYLINSDNAKILDNHFMNNSYGNIFNQGNHYSIIQRNKFLLPGNLSVGDAIDILDSTHIDISHNTIESDSCFGIAVANSHHVTIHANTIIDGITYAIAIGDLNADFLSNWMHAHKIQSTSNSHIIISNNYFSQNRYGLGANRVDTLIVENNFFVQKFPDNHTRKFWTDNTHLLKNVTNLIWSNNLYKEGFTQINGGNNTMALRVVPFPVTGGVSF